MVRAWQYGIVHKGQATTQRQLCYKSLEEEYVNIGSDYGDVIDECVRWGVRNLCESGVMCEGCVFLRWGVREVWLYGDNPDSPNKYNTESHKRMQNINDK